MALLGMVEIQEASIQYLIIRLLIIIQVAAVAVVQLHMFIHREVMVLYLHIRGMVELVVTSVII